ncbi:hypothetical protein B0H17DRAFT_1072186 [Mycena rosella]|uniref:MYND-type domain-containing protein n=1 Tax=Mycena rosella TaxID=1033263 RepID=A0AAD7GFC1_MYCRO|nr:hypothetical protein B0H17DRAFT_1072186 [Mycena rosella]
MRVGAGKFRKVKANLPPEAQPWPNCVSDVIPGPGGEQEVLEGLVQWAAHGVGGHGVFVLIGALARFWEPFAVRLFQNNIVFSLATQHLQYALAAYDPRVHPAEQMMAFTAPVVACAEGLFHTLSELDMGCTISLLHPIFEPMYAMAVAIEPILLRTRTFTFLADSRRWFHLIRQLRNVIAPDGSWIRSPDGVPALGPHTHYAAAFHRVVEIRNRNQCRHIACTSKIEARSSVCSRCGIVRYCSHECLEAAWAAPRLPHKSLCKQITALRAATLLADDKAWANTVRDSQVHRSPAGFANMYTALSVDPRIAEAIWRGILLVTDEKMQFATQAAELGADNQPKMLTAGEDAGPPSDQVPTADVPPASPLDDHRTTTHEEPIPEEEVD